MVKYDNIKVDGYFGRWHVVDTNVFHRPMINGTEDIPVWFLEHNTYGDEAAQIIVDENLNVVLDDVWNGELDLREYEELLQWEVGR